MTLKIAHIINPVAAEIGSRFHFVQQVTYHTMQVARSFSARDVEIEFLSVQYPEDHEIIPENFSCTPDLERSVLDLGSFRHPRKLPLLFDILSLADENSSAEYLIYTNVDIGVMPYFYRSVATYIREGFDAFTINRRTISEHYQDFAEIPLMYADFGEPHRGWDCFVFRREIIPDFRLGSVCVGAPLIGLALLSNLMVYSEKFRQFKKEHLTFHLGNDRSWHNSPFVDYATHNQRQVLQILRELDTESGGFSRQSPPGRYLFYQRYPILARLYAALMKLYIPAKYTRHIR